MPLPSCYPTTNLPQPNTVISLDTAERPKWLRGKEDGSILIKNELYLRIGLFRSHSTHVSATSILRPCCICLDDLTFNGATIDHIIDWKKYARNQYGDQITRIQLEQSYHDTANLVVVHSNCNSAKGQKDLMQYWKSPLAFGKVHPVYRERIRFAIDRTNLKSFELIPKEHRVPVLNHLIYFSRDLINLHSLRETFQKIGIYYDKSIYRNASGPNAMLPIGD